MNALRRVLLVLYSLVLLAALGGIGSLAWNQDEQLDLTIGDLNMQAFVDASDNAKLALTGVLAGIGVLALLTLVLAIWPKRAGFSSKDTLRIRQADGGTVEVTAGAVESLIRDELEALPEVTRATPRIRLTGGAVDTHLDAHIEPSVSIAQATKIIGGTVEQVLREHVGVTSVRRPVIRITYDEMSARPTGSPLRRTAPLYEPPPLASEPQPMTGAATQTRPPTAADPARPAEAPHFTSPNEESTTDDSS